MTSPQRPALYARVSTTDQDCALQLAELRKHLDHMGWPQAQEYVDHGFSGAKASRPAFDRLMKAAIAGEHDCILVWKIDRFGRSVLHFLQNLAQLQNANVRFLAVSQALDTDSSNPVSRFLLMILAAVAEFERELILERSATGRARKLANGEPDAWIPSYGWGVTNGKPHPIPAEQDALNRIMRWRREAKSVFEIMDLLVAAKIKPKRAKQWRQNSLLRIFANRTAIGEYRRCGTVYAMPFTLVDPALFHEVQSVSETVRPQKQGRPSKQFLLAGFAQHCKKRMKCEALRPEAKQDYRYYQCQLSHHRAGRICKFQKIRAIHLENAVWRALWALLKDPEYFHQLAVAFAEEKRKGAKPERDPAKKLRAAQAEERRVLMMCRKGMYTIEDGEKLQWELQREITKLELEVRALNKVLQIAPPLSVVEQTLKALTEGPEPEGYADRRLILEGLVDFRVEILSANEARVTGKLPLAETEENAGDSRRKNCANTESSLNSFLAQIPFEIRVKIAA